MLLCSLLLGWGFNAYVAMGNIYAAPTGGGGGSGAGGGGGGGGISSESSYQPHTWVITFDDALHITFWESLTGEQITFARKTYKQGEGQEEEEEGGLTLSMETPRMEQR